MATFEMNARHTEMCVLFFMQRKKSHISVRLSPTKESGIKYENEMNKTHPVTSMIISHLAFKCKRNLTVF